MDDTQSIHRGGGAHSAMASSSTSSPAKRKIQYQSRAARSIFQMEQRISSLESKRSSLPASAKGNAAADLDSDLNDFGLMYNGMEQRVADLEEVVGNGAGKGVKNGTKAENGGAESADEELRLLGRQIADLEDVARASRDGDLEERLSGVEEQVAKGPSLQRMMSSQMDGLHERMEKVEKKANKEPFAREVSKLLGALTERVDGVEKLAMEEPAAQKISDLMDDFSERLKDVESLTASEKDVGDNRNIDSTQQLSSLRQQIAELQEQITKIQDHQGGFEETYERLGQTQVASDKNIAGRFHDISKRTMHLEQQQSKRSDIMDTVHNRLKWLEDASKEPREPKAPELSHRVHRLDERLLSLEEGPAPSPEVVSTGLRVDELLGRLAKLENQQPQHPAWEERINAVDRQLLWKDEEMRHRVSALERNAVKTQDVDERVKRLVQQLADADGSSTHEGSTPTNNSKLADKVNELDQHILTKEIDWNSRLDDLERRLPKGPSIAYSNDLVRRVGDLEARLKQPGVDISSPDREAGPSKDVEMARRVEDLEKSMTAGPTMKILESVQVRLASLEKTVTSTNASSMDSAKRVFDLETKFEPYKEYKATTKDAVQNLKNLEGAILTYKGEMAEEKRAFQTRQTETNTKIALAEADIKVLTEWINGLKQDVKALSAPRALSTGALVQSLLERLEGGETLEPYNAFRLRAKLDLTTSQTVQQNIDRIVRGSSSRGGDGQHGETGSQPEGPRAPEKDKGVQPGAQQRDQTGQQAEQGAQRSAEPNYRPTLQQIAQQAQQAARISAEEASRPTPPQNVLPANGAHPELPKGANAGQGRSVGMASTTGDLPTKRPNDARSQVDERPAKRTRMTPNTEASTPNKGVRSAGRSSSSALSSVADFDGTPSTRTTPSGRRRQSSHLDEEDEEEEEESSPEIRRTSRTFKPTKRQEEYEKTKTERKHKPHRRPGKSVRGSSMGLGLPRRRVRFPCG